MIKAFLVFFLDGFKGLMMILGLGFIAPMKMLQIVFTVRYASMRTCCHLGSIGSQLGTNASS